MSERMIKVGLCGFGVVGQGVFDHLDRKRAVLSEQLGAEITVSRIAVRNIGKARDIAVDASIVTDDPLAVAMDPEIEVICELMGGGSPCRFAGGKNRNNRQQGAAMRFRRRIAFGRPRAWRSFAFRSERRWWDPGY